METFPYEEVPANSELSQTNGETERRSEDGVIGSQPTSSRAEVTPTRRRCLIVGTATTELAVAEPEGSREANDRRTAVKFVPRPSVPTLSRAEIVMRQAEDLSVRGNPCITSRKPQNQLLVRTTFFSRIK